MNDLEVIQDRYSGNAKPKSVYATFTIDLPYVESVENMTRFAMNVCNKAEEIMATPVNGVVNELETIDLNIYDVKVMTNLFLLIRCMVNIALRKSYKIGVFFMIDPDLPLSSYDSTDGFNVEARNLRGVRVAKLLKYCEAHFNKKVVPFVYYKGGTEDVSETLEKNFKLQFHAEQYSTDHFMAERPRDSRKETKIRPIQPSAAANGPVHVILDEHVVGNIISTVHAYYELLRQQSDKASLLDRKKRYHLRLKCISPDLGHALGDVLSEMSKLFCGLDNWASVTVNGVGFRYKNYSMHESIAACKSVNAFVVKAKFLHHPAFSRMSDMGPKNEIASVRHKSVQHVHIIHEYEEDPVTFFHLKQVPVLLSPVGQVDGVTGREVSLLEYVVKYASPAMKCFVYQDATKRIPHASLERYYFHADVVGANPNLAAIQQNPEQFKEYLVQYTNAQGRPRDHPFGLAAFNETIETAILPDLPNEFKQMNFVLYIPIYSSVEDMYNQAPGIWNANAELYGQSGAMELRARMNYEQLQYRLGFTVPGFIHGLDPDIANVFDCLNEFTRSGKQAYEYKLLLDKRKKAEEENKRLEEEEEKRKRKTIQTVVDYDTAMQQAAVHQAQVVEYARLIAMAEYAKKELEKTASQQYVDVPDGGEYAKAILDMVKNTNWGMFNAPEEFFQKVLIQEYIPDVLRPYVEEQRARERAFQMNHMIKMQEMQAVNYAAEVINQTEVNFQHELAALVAKHEQELMHATYNIQNQLQQQLQPFIAENSRILEQYSKAAEQYDQAQMAYAEYQDAKSELTHDQEKLAREAELNRRYHQERKEQADHSLKLQRVEAIRNEQTNKYFEEQARIARERGQSQM